MYTRRELAVSHCTPILTTRGFHAAMYHTPHPRRMEKQLRVRGTYVLRSDRKLCLLSLKLARVLVEQW
jgi:hypothetical protein